MNGWLMSALLGVICLAVFFRQQKGDVELDCPDHWGNHALRCPQQGAARPVVWLLAILAVAVIAYRIYRKYSRS